MQREARGQQGRAPTWREGTWAGLKPAWQPASTLAKPWLPPSLGHLVYKTASQDSAMTLAPSRAYL